jgi:hypothetical protein
VPSPCSTPPCTVTVVVESSAGVQYAHIAYRD